MFAGDAPASTLASAVRAGRLRRLARGVYTDRVDDPPEVVARELWLPIAAYLFPGSVITDRSAARAAPIDGVLYLSGPRRATTEMPGLTIVSRQGPGPIDGDLPLPGGLHLASRPRALLDNARPTRASARRPAPTLRAAELADWVDHLSAIEGDETMREIRRRLPVVAHALRVPGTQLEAVDSLIGAALGTRPAPGRGPLAARSRGLPYDQARIATFERLVEALLDRPVTDVVALEDTADRRRFLPFFEAYFSNFIEGTEFSPSEARDIVGSGVPPADRPADGHDVLATYRLLADETALGAEPPTTAAALERLQRWNAEVMAARPGLMPGEWKRQVNRAGTTTFVAPDLVVGTLTRGWELRDRLHTPFQRAALALFVVSEVHPFTDGNGRVARLAMTAELVAGAAGRIIVPTVSRNDYLNGLRRLTRQDRADLLIDVLDRLQRFTSRIDFTSYDVAEQQLSRANAFVAADDAERSGVHLRMPDR